MEASRKAYLEGIWSKNPYPPSARQKSLTTARGRLSELNEGLLKLLSEGKILEFSMTDKTLLAEGFRPWDCLREGDLVEIKFKKEKKKFFVSKITLLVPSEGPNPFKLQKFGQAESLQWQKFTQVIRKFFSKEKFIELRTPTLVPSPGLEPFLDPFKTEFFLGRNKKTFFLPTSPEFHLKKTLTMGFERCFEFKECFRNNELSEHHQPEFLMLEWYRAYSDTQDIISDVKTLLFFLQKAFSKKIQKVTVVTMEKLWKDILKFNLTPQTTQNELLGLAQKLGIESKETESFDDIFSRFFLERIEPVLASKKTPMIVWHYPPSQAALARLTKEGWADRFELYWNGLEIANAFYELNDANEQRRRFIEDQNKKKKLGKEFVPIDEEFMAALKWGLPPSAGIALGVERLFMALFGLRTLDQGRLFPLRLE